MSQAPNYRVTTAVFNSETESVKEGTIVLSSSGRSVYRGATEGGFAFSLTDGASWTYGGALRPASSAFPVIWSDPAATTSMVNPRFVFASFLAVAEAKFPSTNHIDGSIIPYLGGACIYRSVDYGQHFSGSFYDCLRATDVDSRGDFYDGGSMAAAPDGSIYAAFHDVDTLEIHVWRAPGASSFFSRMPTPFPNRRMIHHPRLRVDPTTNNVYVLAAGRYLDDLTTYLFITRWDGSSWSSPAQASFLQPEPQPELVFSNGNARRAPDYSFDVGATSGAFGDTDAVRILYTTKDNTNRHHVVSSRCQRSLSNCFPASWSTLAVRGDQFSPVVLFAPSAPLGPFWKASWMTREDEVNGSTFQLRQGNLAVLGNLQILIGLNLTGSYPVCQTTTTEYFGDYDDMQIAGAFDNGSPRFLRTFSDSSAGCFDQWPYSSWHLHVSVVPFE